MRHGDMMKTIFDTYKMMEWFGKVQWEQEDKSMI